jgi:hypothetical protein
MGPILSIKFGYNHGSITAQSHSLQPGIADAIGFVGTRFCE